MEERAENNSIRAPADQDTVSSSQPDLYYAADNQNNSIDLFSESPVYEPENTGNVFIMAGSDSNVEAISKSTDEEISNAKRKLTDQIIHSVTKRQKVESSQDIFSVSTQTLDDEVSEITDTLKHKLKDNITPSTSQALVSSPKKIVKRCISAEMIKSKTPTTPKSRAASVETTRKSPNVIEKSTDLSIVEKDTSFKSSQRSSVEFICEIPASAKTLHTINEECNTGMDNSQDIRLVMSPSPDEIENEIKYNSDVVIAKNRDEILDPGIIQKSHSDGYVYSDHSFSQSRPKNISLGKSIDQESTDSVSSIHLESPTNKPSMASKLISKLSNGNSSTPTELTDGKILSGDSDSTPDMIRLNTSKGKQSKNESYRMNSTTTPSTISPLQNGHTMDTPQIPNFDVHTNYNEDNELVSLYIVRTDNNLGMDMYKEYQRLSKKFTSADAYLGDVSVSTSPSSVTSGGLITLPNRTYASIISSTSSSSNRTSDGTFVVPQAPRKSTSHPYTSIKGYDSLMKILQNIFSHFKDVSEVVDDKVSVAIQTSIDGVLSNGNASPGEVNKCDKVTPKSSLKKTRVRGRRQIAGKTKRAILSTQPEEPEYMHGINSPEIVPTNSENGKESPVKSLKDEKSLATLATTPKSIGKSKQKRRPISPRPATPVEKVIVKQEYSGYQPNTLVLARWVNKCYYSGKVLEITEPNKYLIEFDDGRKKVLLDEFIIFGDMKTLPLVGQSVYAVVDEEQNYEPALVLSVDENDSGTITYKCTTDGDTMVMVTGNELYLTEDQARLLKESYTSRSPSSTGLLTPRRRHNRELDLDNIIQGPRSARSRDKNSASVKKRVVSPKSPKASTSGVKTKTVTPIGRKRVPSESSEMSESSNSAPSVRIEEVAGVEPEVQRTPRKIDGVKAGPLQLKGAAKQNIGKKNSKLTKFENDEDTVSILGPILTGDGKLFAGMHFLLTCTEIPKQKRSEKSQETRHYSSEEDGESTSVTGTDTEDLEFCNRPFNKERLREQLEAAGGIVYSHFDDVPKSKYSVCKLIAPRPCLTVKYILCLAADIRALSHGWVITSCINNSPADVDSYALPTGWSLQKKCFINWVPPSGKRNATFFKDKIILLCGDQDTFVKFWERVCTLAGAITRVVNEEDLNTNGAIALVTEWDCPHEVQNKANQENIPLVSTTWIVQCLIESKVISPTGHDRFSFMYAEPE